MKTLLVSLASLLLAAAAFPESADLRISVQVSPAIPRAGDLLIVRAVVANDGPDTARNVWASIRFEKITIMEIDGLPPPEPKRPCPGSRCFLGDIPPGSTAALPDFSESLPLSDFTMSVSADATGDTPDPQAANNAFRKTFTVTTAPRIRVFLGVAQFADPGLPFDLRLSMANDGTAPATNAVATAELPDGVEVVSLPAGCVASPGKIACTKATLPHQTAVQAVFDLKLRAPRRYEGGEIVFRATAEASQASAKTRLYRTFLVTSAADRGAGSLRQAIESANAACAAPERCAIQFNIAGSEPWQTIRLRSALPPVRGVNLRIDGTTQSEFSGVKNPDGPSIEISGGFHIGGAGLEIDGLGIQEIANLAINGFRGDGILLNFDRIQSFGPASSIHHNYIGTDPTGNVAVPNHRGIALREASPRVFPATTILGNLISGNSRSGILAVGGGLEVLGNRIGLVARREAPLPNGGSGIFLDRSSDRVEVRSNAIAFNREIGVAVHPEAKYVNVQANRIWANGGLPIDDGLDGPSPAVSTDDGPLVNPVVTYAAYDSALQATTIRGFAPPGTFVAIYASKAPGDAERYLVTALARHPGGEFAAAAGGDYRGQWIAATATRTFLSPYPNQFTLGRTSEVGAGVQAQ
jgi:Right handed beta helix region